MKNTVKLTAVLLLVTVRSVNAQGTAPGAFVGLGPEINGLSRSGVAIGGGISLGFDFSLFNNKADFSAGQRTSFYHNLDTISTLEVLGFFRYYLPWLHLPRKIDGPFVQAEAGCIVFFEDEINLPVFSGGLSVGWRFLFPRKNNSSQIWYIEPAARVGYPHLWGVNVTVGIRFKSIGENQKTIVDEQKNEQKEKNDEQNITRIEDKTEETNNEIINETIEENKIEESDTNVLDTNVSIIEESNIEESIIEESIVEETEEETTIEIAKEENIEESIIEESIVEETEEESTIEIAKEEIIVEKITEEINKDEFIDGIKITRDTDGNIRLQVSPIVFPANSADFTGLSPETIENNYAVINSVAELLNKHQNYRIIIEGHANPTRAESAIRERERHSLIYLSGQRALKVLQELGNLGVSYSRMNVLEVGSKKTIVPYNDYENNWKNNRVEFILIQEKEGVK